MPLDAASNLVSIVGEGSSHFNLPQVELNCCFISEKLVKTGIPNSLRKLAEEFVAFKEFFIFFAILTPQAEAVNAEQVVILNV